MCACTQPHTQTVHRTHGVHSFDFIRYLKVSHSMWMLTHDWCNSQRIICPQSQLHYIIPWPMNSSREEANMALTLMGPSLMLRGSLIITWQDQVYVPVLLVWRESTPPYCCVWLELPCPWRGQRLVLTPEVLLSVCRSVGRWPEGLSGFGYWVEEFQCVPTCFSK